MTGRGEAAVLGIDLGTTELKVGIVALDGQLLAAGRGSYPTTMGPGGRAEQDPEAWWGALVEATRQALADAPAVEIRAICADGHGPTFVPVAADGRATRPAITWLDTRPAAESDDLAAAIGMVGWELGVLPGALWLERHEPAAATAARWYCASWEWLAFRLSEVAGSTRLHGQRLPDRTWAASTGLAVDHLAPVVDSGSVIGELTPAAAADLGLPAGLPVVAGAVDAYASLFGSGVLEPGQAVDTGGASGGIAILWDALVQVPGAYVAEGPLPGRFVLGGAMAATGKAVDWFREDVLRGTLSGDELIAEAAVTPPGAGGLVFLPYLAGERSPIWDPTARGAFVGLSLAHGRGHLARAILEGAAFALRHIAEPIRAAGVRLDELRVSGGPARSDTWNQVKADVLDVPVAVPLVPETAVMGSAALAATGVGVYPDVRDAIRAMVRVDRVLEPRSDYRATYDAAYAIYRELYPALIPTFGRIAALRAASEAG